MYSLKISGIFSPLHKAAVNLGLYQMQSILHTATRQLTGATKIKPIPAVLMQLMQWRQYFVLEKFSTYHHTGFITSYHSTTPFNAIREVDWAHGSMTSMQLKNAWEKDGVKWGKTALLFVVLISIWDDSWFPLLVYSTKSERQNKRKFKRLRSTQEWS